jgi:hypothetical protein
MTTDKKGFFRGFTWKRFVRVSLLIFVVTYLFSIVGNYIDKTETIASLFTLKQLLKKSLSALILGFLITLWHEPGVDDKKR